MAIDLQSSSALNQTERILRSANALTHPAATIVIPAYNAQAHIAKTLRSVARAVFEASVRSIPVEVLVVTNTSTDDTAGIAVRCGARVIEEPQKGVHFARQAGLEQASGPVILGTDADAIVPPAWITAHERHYQSNEVVGVAGDHHVRGSSLIQIVRRFIPKPWTKNKRFDGSNSSYRREAAMKVGGFVNDPNHKEDDLWQKLREEGKIVWEPSPAVRVETRR